MKKDIYRSNYDTSMINQIKLLNQEAAEQVNLPLGSIAIFARFALIDVPTQSIARETLHVLLDMVELLGLEPPQVTVLTGPVIVDGVMSPSALKVPHSLERPTSSPTFALASARSRVFRNWGKATADNRPIIATTIISSTRVKAAFADVLVLWILSIRKNLTRGFSLDMGHNQRWRGGRGGC